MEGEEGDAEVVLAWLDADERRDVNDICERSDEERSESDEESDVEADDGGTLLEYAALNLGCTDLPRENAHEKLRLAAQLIERGADVNGHDGCGAFEAAFCGRVVGSSGELVRDFVKLLLDKGLVLTRSQRDRYPPLHSTIVTMKFDQTRPLVEIVSMLLRHGAPLDAPVRSVEEVIQRCEGSYTDLPEKPLWVAATALVHGVRAAGGTWAAYRRLPRKEVLRLRSLSKRGRAKATDPVIDRVFQLPNELAWCVLDFWRATSAATGEVI